MPTLTLLTVTPALPALGVLDWTVVFAYFRGAPVTLVVAGILALAFMGFTGLASA